MLSCTRGEPDPAGDEHAQHVTMGEQRDVARDSARSGNDPVRPVTDLLRRLAARGSVPEDEPARRSLVDLLRCQPLVGAIIPLDQIGFTNGARAEAR